MELAGEGGNDFAERSGGAGRGGNDVFGARSSTPWVTVTSVKDALVIGVGMDGGHHAMAKAKLFVQHSGYDGQCIGGAGGGGNDLMLVGIIVVFVDADDQGDIGPLAGRGDQDTFGTGLQVRGRLIGGGKDTGGLNDQFDAEFAPGDIQGVKVRDDAD